MKKVLLLMASSFILTNVSNVSAQVGNEDKISILESKIKELQAEIDSLRDEEPSNESSPVSEDELEDELENSDMLGMLEGKDGSFIFKEAYIYDDEYANSGKSVLFIVEYTNTSGEPEQPSSAVIWGIDAEQETDIQIFSLDFTSNYDRSDFETYKNRNIDLKDGATIEIEISYQLEITDSDIALSASWSHEKDGEVFLTISPSDLDPLP